MSIEITYTEPVKCCKCGRVRSMEDTKYIPEGDGISQRGVCPHCNCKTYWSLGANGAPAREGGSQVRAPAKMTDHELRVFVLDDIQPLERRERLLDELLRRARSKKARTIALERVNQEGGE